VHDHTILRRAEPRKRATGALRGRGAASRNRTKEFLMSMSIRTLALAVLLAATPIVALAGDAAQPAAAPAAMPCPNAKDGTCCGGACGQVEGQAAAQAMPADCPCQAAKKAADAKQAADAAAEK